jgi:hypothetical protein
MSKITRIVRLLEQTFEGKPYYGPSVLDTLTGVNANIAAMKPQWSAHRIWDLVAHLTAELYKACAVIDGTSGLWTAGETTWSEITDISNAAWQQAVADLKKTKRALVRLVNQLNDDVIDKKPFRVRSPFYQMLHGTIQHNIFHARQISLLTDLMISSDKDEHKTQSLDKALLCYEQAAQYSVIRNRIGLLGGSCLRVKHLFSRTHEN